MLLGLLITIIDLALTAYVVREIKDFVFPGKVKRELTSEYSTSLTTPPPTAHPSPNTVNTSVLFNASAPANIWNSSNVPKNNRFRRSRRRFEFERKRFCTLFNKTEECTTAALFACAWCHDYGCTHKPDLFCPELLDRGIETHCPFTVQASTIEAGTVKEFIGDIGIMVKMKIPDPSVPEYGMVCKVTRGGTQVFVKGFLTDHNVFCERCYFSLQEFLDDDADSF